MPIHRDVEVGRAVDETNHHDANPPLLLPTDLTALLGFDKKGHRRALFLYDGGWGVWKFLVGFVADRDALDHIRFVPIQTRLAQDLCLAHRAPADVSTAVLFEKNVHGETHHTHSDSVLRLLYHLGLPYYVLGFLALLIPKILRDFGYGLFARNRGRIWIGFKKITCMGDTPMHAYRDVVVGLDGEDTSLPESWGLGGVEASSGGGSLEHSDGAIR